MTITENQELKTIKIPESDFQKLEEVRKLLAIRGINSLDQEIRKDAERNIENSKNITWGIIIGIGATLLIQALND